MAYAAVASLLQTIDILLNHHQHSIFPQFKDQIVSIHEHTSFLRSFIEGSSDRVNNWEGTIRQVTDKAEDIIELLLSDLLLESSVGGSSGSELEKAEDMIELLLSDSLPKSAGVSSTSKFEKGKYEVRYGYDELEKVADEIKSIVSRVMGGRRIKTSVSSDDEVNGIVFRLRGGSSSLERIAICGGGGMGKSTLAVKAYIHPLVKEHFDVRAGSRITKEFILLRVIEDFLLSMNVEYTSISEEEFIERLLQILGVRTRYLIVVDDVRSMDVMERLMTILPDYDNGSRIIFTTRSLDLANSAHHIHEMSLLDEDKSWNLLREKIFEGDRCPFQLEAKGKMIAKGCGGHLLSIEVVSGILAADQTKAAWGDVSDNISIITEDSDKLSEILYLSYIYLPHHLRPCLLYLGIFPQDRAIHVSQLVKLWVAEGFVNGNGSKSLEETGEEYVEDLFKRCLVFVNTKKCNGKIKSIGVHDLIRGMCLRQAR